MSGGNPIEKITDTVMDAVKDVSPLIDHIVDPFDILPDTIGIPGTNLRVSLASFLLGPLIGLPFIPFRRDSGGGNELPTIAPSNPYIADLKVYVNDVPNSKVLFQTPPGFSSVDEVTKYFKENASVNYTDICVLYPNSTISFLFNDTNFDDNDGVINISICYLGENESCNSGKYEQDINTIAVGFSRVDPNLKYPVPCHGMVYVGDKDNGLSTGGRCEVKTLDNAQTKLAQKYSKGYSIDFDDTETSNELEKSRVLDLVYKFNGSTWIRQQNMVESVYYHSGVGDQNHSIFFGGIHDTISNYSFSYTDDIGNLPIPEFSDFNFDNKFVTNIIQDRLYGESYPSDLNSSQCWEAPKWSVDSNFNIIPNRISNPLYTPALSANYFGFLRDPDFPIVKFVSIQPNGSFEFGTTDFMYETVLNCSAGGWWNHICIPTTTSQVTTVSEVISGSNVIFNYPTIDTITVSANLGSALQNNFLVKAATSTISGTVVEFNGEVQIKEVYLDYPNRAIIYPNNISGNPLNEQKYFSLKSINSNSENINLVGAFQHSFDYTTLTGATSAYLNRGLFTVRFNSLDDIYEGIKNRQNVTGIENFTIIDSTLFPISGSYISGNARVRFDVIDRSAVMIGVENKNYLWKDSLEDSLFDLTTNLSINAKIGTLSEERWGVPLWSAAFINATDYTGNYTFNSRLENSDGNVGNILHEITSFVLESNSLMALANKRIFINGETLAQNHNYTTLNDLVFKANWKVDEITYEPNSLGLLYNQINNLFIVGDPLYTYTPSAAASVNISGSMISISAPCCSGEHNYPSNLFLTSVDSTPISSESGISYINMTYNYIDGCVWEIDSTTYTPSSVGQVYSFTYSGNCIYSCPINAVESLITGVVYDVSGGTAFTFPSDNFVVISESASVNIGNTYEKQITHHFLNGKTWKVQYIDVEQASPLVGCSLTIGPFVYINSPNYTVGTATEVVSSAVSGSIYSMGDACCSGNKLFPQDFIFESSTMIPSGNDLYNNVVYKLYNGCTTDAQATVNVVLIAKHDGALNTTLKACPAGEVIVKIINTETLCEKTITHVNSIAINIAPSGSDYAEYATNFVQEYKDDERYKVPEYWITSNGNNIISKNNGINKNSKWKRYMDGVGLGGDTPDYDTIYNTKAKQTYEIGNWKEIGYWNIGQMAFGTPDKCVVVGGHKVSRNTGNTLIGSGMHANNTSKRIYIWDTSVIPEEDSFLKNYYGRRFNTYYSSETMTISSNQNRSNLDCIIFDAESDIVVERFGTATFDGSTNSLEVKFDKEMPDEVDTNYSISMTCDDNIKVWWDNKTKSGFTIKTEISTWSGKVDYIASTIIKVTEKDITEKPSDEGLNWNK